MHELVGTPVAEDYEIKKEQVKNILFSLGRKVTRIRTVHIKRKARGSAGDHSKMKFVFNLFLLLVVRNAGANKNEKEKSKER